MWRVECLSNTPPCCFLAPRAEMCCWWAVQSSSSGNTRELSPSPMCSVTCAVLISRCQRLVGSWARVPEPSRMDAFPSVFTISVLLLALRETLCSALTSPVLLGGGSCLLLLQGRNEAVTWWPRGVLALFWFLVMFAFCRGYSVLMAVGNTTLVSGDSCCCLSPGLEAELGPLCWAGK